MQNEAIAPESAEWIKPGEVGEILSDDGNGNLKWVSADTVKPISEWPVVEDDLLAETIEGDETYVVFVDFDAMALAIEHVDQQDFEALKDIEKEQSVGTIEQEDCDDLDQDFLRSVFKSNPNVVLRAFIVDKPEQEDEEDFVVDFDEVIDDLAKLFDTYSHQVVIVLGDR